MAQPQQPIDLHPNYHPRKRSLIFHSNCLPNPSSDALVAPAVSSGRESHTHPCTPHHLHASCAYPAEFNFRGALRKRRRRRGDGTGVCYAHDRLQLQERDCMQVQSNLDDENSCRWMQADRDTTDDGGVDPPPLDPCLWKALPAELLERIFACLPIGSLFRFRAVRRSWNTAPLRPQFRALRAQVMMPEAWLLMLATTPPSVVPARNVSSQQDSCLSFVSPKKCSRPAALTDPFLPFPPGSGQFSYCANAGGLICYHYHKGFSAHTANSPVNSLWVGNPFTKEWKCLPSMVGSFPLNYPLRGLVGMVADDRVRTSQPVHYKIVVRTQSLHSWGSGMMTEEYDSHTDSWRITTTANVPFDHRIEQVLHCTGSLYFLTWLVRDGVYVYHLATQQWEHILPPEHLQFTSPHMVECCGRLVLVSGVGKYHSIKLKGVRHLHIRITGIELWQLAENDRLDHPSESPTASPIDGGVPTRRGSAWISLGNMPEELVKEFVTGAPQFHCTSIQDLIYLTNNISMLIFHAVPRTWRRVIIAKLPYLVQDFVSFMPRLEASP